MGWLFHRELSNRERFAPDLVADKDIQPGRQAVPAARDRLDAARPALVGGLVTWSWQGALTAFFWAGLVRIGLLHHVTWSINSVCHVYGERPFEVRSGDKAANFWPLAILSFGESWHNLHHADPTCARHGVLRGQIDISARVIWLFEKIGWAYDVRWPKPERLAAKMVKPRTEPTLTWQDDRVTDERAPASHGRACAARDAPAATAGRPPTTAGCGCPRRSAASS